MKTLLVASVAVSFTFTFAGHSQSTVQFANTPATAITTNNLQGATGLMSGAGAYRIGLYAGPFGAGEGSLLLVATAANGATPGLFNGGNVAVPFPGGGMVSFQVRAWSAFGGSSYEEALSYAQGGGVPLAHLGKSDLGFFTVGGGPIIIFGNGLGQVGGFELRPVPEPSVWALMICGVLAYGVFSRRLRPC